MQVEVWIPTLMDGFPTGDNLQLRSHDNSSTLVCISADGISHHVQIADLTHAIEVLKEAKYSY